MQFTMISTRLDRGVHTYEPRQLLPSSRMTSRHEAGNKTALDQSHAWREKPLGLARQTLQSPAVQRYGQSPIVLFGPHFLRDSLSGRHNDWPTLVTFTDPNPAEEDWPQPDLKIANCVQP